MKDLPILLDKVYELEGLILLAMKREESTESLFNLIQRKGSEIGNICKGKMPDINDENQTVNEEENDDASKDSFSFEEYTIDEPEVEDSVQSPVTKSPSSDKKGKLVFSINERFRFKGALFNNSDADFNNTLALIASMEDYEEAEDYFINEVGFDFKNPLVREFLEVIKRYF